MPRAWGAGQCCLGFVGGGRIPRGGPGPGPGPKCMDINRGLACIRKICVNLGLPVRRSHVSGPPSGFAGLCMPTRPRWGARHRCSNLLVLAGALSSLGLAGALESLGLSSKSLLKPDRGARNGRCSSLDFTWAPERLRKPQDPQTPRYFTY